MKYKINTLLYYDATEGSLKVEDGNAETQLTITANALLFFMIQHPGVISRDEVMKRVWDDNGLVSSNSNLNQYLSMLRKAFRRYNIDNIIVTVTHGRLEINPDIEIELIDDTLLFPIQQTPETGYQPPDNQPVTSSRASYFSHERYWSYTCILITLLAILLFSWTCITDSPLHPINLTTIEQGDCELFSTDEITNTGIRKNYVTNFHAIRDKKKIACEKNETFLFFYGDKLQTKGLGRTFMAHCSMYKNNAFSYCDNYFYYSWR